MNKAAVTKPVDATWEVLAAIRFFLAMIVIVSHLQGMVPVGYRLTAVMRLSPFAAVVCFLIISGFSIAHSISRRTEQFYRRRILRIYPLYLIAVILPVALQALRGHLVPHQISNMVENLFFLQTFTTAPLYVNVVVWTLAVEVACYAMAPLFARMGTLALVGIGLVSAAAYLIYPFFGHNYFAFMPHGAALLMLAWAWLAGFIYHRYRRHAVAGIVLAVSVLTVMQLNKLFGLGASAITFGITFAGLTMSQYFSLHRVARNLMAFSGDVSFPLYLLHFPTYYLLNGILHIRTPLVMIAIATVVGMIGVAIDLQLRKPAQVICNVMCETATLMARHVTAIAGAAIELVYSALFARFSTLKSVGESVDPSTV